VTKAGAQLRIAGVARDVHKGETGVRSAGGLVSSSAEPQRGSKERPPRNKPPSLQATASPALEQTSHSSASAPQIEREVAEVPQIGHGWPRVAVLSMLDVLTVAHCTAAAL
jgi:hypothetical protein